MKTAFITGATSGIGMEFAAKFAAQGYRLILTGRRADRLRELQEQYGPECRGIVTDLSDESQCKKLLRDVAECLDGMKKKIQR